MLRSLEDSYKKYNVVLSFMFMTLLLHYAKRVDDSWQKHS